MTAFLVLNELSTTLLAADLDGGKARLEILSDILVSPRIRGRRTLVGPSYLPAIAIAEGYSIGRWLSEYRYGDRDRRERLKILFDRHIGYEECVPLDQRETGNVEYRFAGQLAEGLRVAFCCDGLALSLSSAEVWNVPSLSLEKSWIGDTDVVTRTLTVTHACSVTHLDSHADWLKRIEPSPPQNGFELWERRNTLFPSLDFCEAVRAQISPLRGNEPRFRAIFRGFQDLQNYCNGWDTPNFDIHRLVNASGESQTTMNMYADHRTFLCPDGQYRVFAWHLKRGDTRIHFFDFPAERRILVGYAGQHLPI